MKTRDSQPDEDDFMGGLTTERQKAFVIAYIENGGNGVDAARTAGYESTDSSDLASTALQLLSNLNVAKAISIYAATTRALAHEVLSPAVIMERLDVGFERGLANRQINAAVRAAELQGKQLGMFETRFRITEESKLIDLDLIERLAANDPSLKPRLLALLPKADGFDDTDEGKSSD